MKFLKGSIKVKVLEPIETLGLKSEDVSELTTSIRDKMQIIFNQLNTQISSGQVLVEDDKNL